MLWSKTNYDWREKNGKYRDICYVVKQLNLIDLTHSNTWNCLGEIDDGGLIDVFCDVVIRNTTDKFDHFYDNVEMDLLKALCLYVFEDYPLERKTFPEAYKLLLDKSVEMLDAVFERLPDSHPAKGPYRLFSKAEKVKGNAVLGLGTRLQILQNRLVQQITSHTDIDLTLPGREKCAYFCITSDQDSTYDMLATARSRGIGMCILFQNIPQLQNRYLDNQWEEILGGCDFSIFLGCNDMTTASYFSDRTGEITVNVETVRKNFYTIRVTDYVPEYAKSMSVGKRQLLLPDEILRYPLDQGLLIIRGQKVLRFRKMDYTEHPDAGKLKMEKVEAHIPAWFAEWEKGKQDFKVLEKRELRAGKQEEWHGGQEGRQEREPPLLAGMECKKGEPHKKQSGVMKVEDLFAGRT